jgi:hypothetical protein
MSRAKNCSNCGGTREVSVSLPCPQCARGRIANPKAYRAVPEFIESARATLQAVNWSHEDRLMTELEIRACALARKALKKAGLKI